MTESLPFFDADASAGSRVLQLYAGLELFSEGSPPANSLFLLGQPAPFLNSDDPSALEQLLIIDPPPGVTTRFTVPSNTAVLFTGTPVDVGLPKVETKTGGVAHVRIGEHFLDIYAQQDGAVIHLPAVGVLAGGSFGAGVQPPRIAVGSDGSRELETLRLIARLVKSDRFQLYIPYVGELLGEKPAVLDRLAVDVGYLHGIQRTLPKLVAQDEAFETVERSVTPSCLRNGGQPRPNSYTSKTYASSARPWPTLEFLNVQKVADKRFCERTQR